MAAVDVSSKTAAVIHLKIKNLRQSAASPDFIPLIFLRK